MSGKEMNDPEMDELFKHLDYICTVMHTCIQPLYDAKRPEVIIGFVLAPMAYFEGSLEVIESEGVLQAEVERPTDPKKLN